MIRWVLVLALLFTEPAASQDSGGVRADLTLGIGGEISRDPLLNGASSKRASGVGILKFNLSSETRTQRIKLGLEGGRFGGARQQSKVQLDYSRSTKSSSLRTYISSQRIPEGGVDAHAFSSADLGALDLASGQSVQRIRSGGVTLKVGLGQPVGAVLSYGKRVRKVLDVIPARRSAERLNAEVNLRLNARTEGKISWAETRLKSNGATTSTNTDKQLRFGVSHHLRRTLEVTLDGGWQDLKATGFVDSGLMWRSSFTQHLKSGKRFLFLSRNRTVSGPLVRMQAGLSRNHPAYSLELAVGMARLKDQSAEPTLVVSYDAKFTPGSLNISASRDFFGSDDSGETRIGTKFDMEVVRDFDPTRSLGLTVGYLKTNSTSQTPARSVGHIGATYRHQLQQDFNLVVGAHRRRRSEAALGKRSSNSVFITFEKRFAGRF
ncbi:hypothetical protein [uncultured Litoreibacter sp.]|uniref:hypothetical protein n=1 Tax=uncultured Litoreibacter sp. TaxID=1392394 RepID=UPI00262D7638|nr:hypothetical protein [uncultured Litoreibacter sp.]